MSKKLLLPKDLQQARLDEKWSQLKGIFDAWASKLTNVSDEVEIFRCLILGESALEQTINESVSQSKDFRKDELFRKASDYLMHGLQLCDRNKERHGPVSAELHLLLAKYHFFVNDYTQSIQSVDKSQVTRDNVEELSKRACILASEAFSFKGKILERMASNTEKADVESAIAAYQLSAELALWIYTDEYRSASIRKTQETVSQRSLPTTLLTSFCKPVQLALQRGNIHDAIGYYRSFLRVVESKGTTTLRKIMTLQLAEILLFGSCDRNYIAPPLQAWQQQGVYQSGALAFKTYQQRSLSTSSTSGRTTPKPTHKDYTRTSSNKDGSFCPSDEFEEALLLLLISESLLLRDGCVKLFEKDREQRRVTIDEMIAIYDLLCIALTRRQQYGLFLECLERGMKLAYHQFKIWFQYGLALICDKKYKKALMVLKKCHEMRPDDLQVCFFYSKICINYLREYEEAAKILENVVEKAEDPITKSNLYLALGISYSLKASDASNQDQENLLRKRSIDALEKARDLDQCEVEILCQLALNHALSRQVAVAATLVNQALQHDPFHRDSLLLLSLILSAQSRFQESLEILEIALREFPDDFHLLQLKVALTEECYGGEQALNVCQEMLQFWNEMYAEDIEEAGLLQQNLEGKSGKSSILKRSTLDIISNEGSANVAKSIKSLSFADGVKYVNDEDEVSSITASVTLERSLSEVASVSISGNKLKAPAAIALLAKIWLITADVYLNMENSEEAANCILEASSIFPVSPEVLCMRGRLTYMQKNIEEAKACFDSALAVAPKQIEVMEKLAILHHESRSNVMAQKYIRDAIAIDPSKPSLWHFLGVLMEEAGEELEASDCLFTSLDLDATHPILPFTIVSRHFKNGDT